MSYRIREFFGPNGYGSTLEVVPSIEAAREYLSTKLRSRLVLFETDPTHDAADAMMANGSIFDISRV